MARDMGGTISFASQLPADDTNQMQLPQGEIHIWKFSLCRTNAEYQGFEDSLSADERQRADRSHFARHRRRFVARRGLQRLVLSRYCGIAPADIRFAYERNGKPYLPKEDNERGLHFSVSQSADVALLACTRNQGTGIDVEEVREFSDKEEIVSRFFSVQEKAAWRKTLGKDLNQIFFNAWTRKEAFVKALGLGLEIDLNLFSVSFETEDARLLSWVGHDEEVVNWLFYHLEPEPNFCGALVVPKGDWNILLFNH